MSQSHKPQIEAHRGDSANAPENTLAAFRSAIEAGSPWIELDVHPAADGTLMVIHDDTLNRTTSGIGRVNELMPDDIRQFDAGSWFSPEFAGERVPELSEVMFLISGSTTKLNIEIKASPEGMDVPHAVARLLKKFNRIQDYIVSSFDLDTLLQVKDISPQISLALLGSSPGILDTAIRHELQWIHIEHTALSAELIAKAHSRGILVNTWTVNDPAMIPVFRNIHLDKVCTDKPSLLMGASEA